MSEEHTPHAELLAALLEQSRLVKAIKLIRARGFRGNDMEREVIKLGNTIRRLRKEVAKAQGNAA